MTTSQRYTGSKPAARFADMEWHTPDLSEKFQSRLGRRPGTSDSGDTGLGTSASDSTEDFCSSRSSPSFQPIRSQIPIPTAHVMPSTAGALASKSQASVQEESRSSSTSRTSSGSASKSSCLSKSASSPNLDAQPATGSEPAGPKPDCLSRYRSLVNGLDHSLFPTDHTRMDDGQRFDTPAVEPTLNQSALLGGLCPDVRLRLQTTGIRENLDIASELYRGATDHNYKSLPVSRPAVSLPGVTVPSDLSNPKSGHAGAVYASPLHFLRDHTGAKAYDPIHQDRCGKILGWQQQQQQQQQQMDSIRMQMEQMQLNAGVSQYTSLYPSAMHSESGKWDALVKASEGLLKEKELIIERQRQHVSQLEQRLRESELQVHGAFLGRGAPFGDMCLLRLQEAQRENAFLRAQFAERTDCAAMEKAEAERRLGAVEAETRRLTDSLKETCEKHAEEMKKQEDRIKSRDKHINNLKKKCQKESEQKRENQQRIETLERYLADLPTLEDYQSQNKELQEAEQQAARLQEKVKELEASLEATRTQLHEKNTQSEEQKRKERDLLTTITDMQQRVQQGLEDGARLPSLDIEKLRGENNTLREEHQKLKKVIEKQRRMMEQLGSQIKALEVQISHEENSSQALQDDVLAKEESMAELHVAMKKLASQNQELMERNLTLQEQMSELEKSANEASSTLEPSGAHLTQKLHKELSSCLSDLRSVCSILTQRAQGQNPNLSLLLGITSPIPMAEHDEDWISPEVLHKKLVEAQQLRRDVEELRNLILDRYAQDMGENCITQ
ncbi:centrosomal protein of 85 kDa isoform X1 [Syngnathus scovelli]|uniref:centrosomal protein of 85 kDa isoform X1 n=2 Tax=Syngnathus scovelli TaxID=161590 RepID=UPI002110B02F|nr:centrosomal protein of 85 kDa isoform X1 [Syngnathus scovelli]XP_049587177.1 centrosomal protein of 85 kDa isoform X1 [Syngnathus scovelli]XP_049587178.1 centrosomal protein of 85 kDa isoform X1 [Syngnathus scovelli]